MLARARTVAIWTTLLTAFAGVGPSAHAQAPDSASVVRGQVRDFDTGNPLSGAAVSLASGPGGTRGLGTRVTDENGRFTFQRVAPGSYRIIVTLLGYGSLRDTLQVGPQNRLQLILPLSVSPIELEPLLVESERRATGFVREFEDRRRTRSGTFFDRDYIEERQPAVFTDLLRSVPGARVIPVRPYGHTVRMRGNCRPALWVDGMRLLNPEDMDLILHAMDVEAVEVYHSASLPVEFGSHPCGGIVVWTRRGEPTGAGGSFWRRLAFATGFAALVLILSR